MKNENKKKILLIGHSSQLAGGGEDEYERLLKYFSEHKDYEVHGLFPEGPRAAVFARYCYRFGYYPCGFFPVTCTGMFDYLNFFRLYFIQKKPINDFIKAQNYDLCIINVVVLIWPAFFLWRKTKIITFIRETIEPEIFRKVIYKFLNRIVSFFIAVSKTNKEDFVSITGNNDIEVLYSAIEDKLKLTDDKEFYEVTVEKGIDKILTEDRFKIVNVGALYDRKNQFLILNSLKVLKDRGEKIPYVFFIGDTKLDPKYYKSMVGFLEKENLNSFCFFPGPVEKKFYYNLLILFKAIIISSKSEGFPLVLAEALKLKLSIISTDTGGIADVIINNTNGIIIKNNENSLAEAILKMQDTGFSAKISASGFETYKNLLSFENNMKKLNIICNELI